MPPYSPLDRPRSRSRAEIDLHALRHNAAVCAARAGAGCGIMAIVKADAYGHGLRRVVTALTGHVDWLGVANLREAIAAREATGGSDTPILILSPAAPDEIDLVVASEFSGSVSSREEVAAYSEAARRSGTMAKLHAVADTGMGRMGALPGEFHGLVEAIRSDEHCLLEGVETHFPSADEEPDFTASQIESFRQLIEPLELGPEVQIHAGNSAGLLGFQDKLPFATLSRPGLALYGISPLPDPGAVFQPVLSWKSQITLIRDIPGGTSISYGRTFVSPGPMRVATLGVGYGDGFSRHLSGSGAEVLIAGRRCPLLGRVTMDQVVVDISHCPNSVARGDEAVLIGCQENEFITATELAARAGTIPWEILTCITSRVERVYLG